MDNMEQTNPEIRLLSDAELDAVDGGNIFGRIIHAIHDLFAGPGDLRRSTDRPN